uniref:Uncharacterized protein n=1 Tax=Rhizophora mucronata TaxID=61149 RepID=A0A2P2Q7J7_RHIMU
MQQTYLLTTSQPVFLCKPTKSLL